jgi:oligosaccharide repeat unit polymerase
MMISVSTADIVLASSLVVTLIAYVKLSRIEGSYINVLVPSLIVAIPACYFFPWIYIHIFGTGASQYAFVYVYATLAVENVAFVYGYSRARAKVVRLPLRFSYQNFGRVAWICLGLAVAIYVPLLMQFREFLLDPREIYKHTRTGFGPQFYVSSFLAYLAVILILFTKRSWLTKAVVIAVAVVLLLLHGSKGHVLNLVFLLVLFHVYGAGRKVGLGRTFVACSAVALVAVLLFAGTMTLGDGPREVVETFSGYSDYTRNAMMVIDQHFPLQYGRLTIEGNTIALVPRAFMPNKPKDLGGLYLDEVFYPEQLDADAGAPSFGMGMQYADFGVLAIVYLALFGLLRGWLARVFVNRLKLSHHPSDFFMIAFLADVGVFAAGGIGWFLPGALLVALSLRRVSRIGADKVYRDPQKKTSPLQPARMLRPTNSPGSV